MIANQISKVKLEKKNYILIINEHQYTIDPYFYECILPYQGKVLDVKTMLDVISFSKANSILVKMYKKIFNHSYSTYEVKSKLKNNDIPEEDINRIIFFFKDEGLLKEEDFIMYHKERFIYRKGKKAFKTFLESKYISSKAIEKAMDEYVENTDFVYEYAKRYIKNKVGSEKMLKQKLLLQLTNKGFDKKIIEEVILSLTFENEDENLKKEIIKYIRKYPNDKYKVISKLAGKGYNINRIKKMMEEGINNEN